MDEQLKEEILRFFIKNRGCEITYPEDWVKELEEHLLEERFDLETVIQYKKRESQLNEKICKHSRIEEIQGGQIERCRDCGKTWG